MFKKFTTLSLLSLILSISYLHLSYPAQAQTQEIEESILISQNQLPQLPKPDNLPGPTDPENENNPQDIQDYVTNSLIPMAAQRLVTIIAFLVIISLIFAGFKYYTAFGDESKAEEAKKLLQYSILGLVIALMSLAIVSIIGGFAQFFQ